MDSSSYNYLCPSPEEEAGCPWRYPASGRGWPRQRCGAPATLTVRYRATGEEVAYCLNHAQAEVLGGQAFYLEGAHEETREASL